MTRAYTIGRLFVGICTDPPHGWNLFMLHGRAVFLGTPWGAVAIGWL